MDLRHPDVLEKNQDERFIRRVFLPQEQSLIRKERNPTVILWVLWAAKEAAYKLVSQINPLVHSGPLKYLVSLDKPFLQTPWCHYRSGLVESPDGPVAVSVMVSPDYVHAFCCQGEKACQGTLHLKVFCLGHHEQQVQSESFNVRRTLCLYLGRYWQIASRRIGIHRERSVRGLGPPMIYVDETRIQAKVSLSHHGRYGAFAVFASNVYDFQ